MTLRLRCVATALCKQQKCNDRRCYPFKTEFESYVRRIPRCDKRYKKKKENRDKNLITDITVKPVYTTVVVVIKISALFGYFCLFSMFENKDRSKLLF